MKFAIAILLLCAAIGCGDNVTQSTTRSDAGCVAGDKACGCYISEDYNLQTGAITTVTVCPD